MELQCERGHFLSHRLRYDRGRLFLGYGRVSWRPHRPPRSLLAPLVSREAEDLEKKYCADSRSSASRPLCYPSNVLLPIERWNPPQFNLVTAWRLFSQKLMVKKVAPLERRARIICKLLSRHRALTVDTLRVVTEPDQSQAFTRGGRRRRLAAPTEFDQAMALAVERGWLREGHSGVFLTATGDVIGRRTRAGSHRCRWNEVGFDGAPFRVSTAQPRSR